MMELPLPPGSLVLVDSSALVYLVEGQPGSTRRGTVEAFMAQAAARDCSLVASTLVWTELLEKPLGAGDGELAAAYRRLLSDSGRIRLSVVDVAIAERAAALSASLPQALRRKFSLADLVHIATAQTLGAAAILGNDGTWRALPSCPPLLLVDELAFELGNQ